MVACSVTQILIIEGREDIQTYLDKGRLLKLVKDQWSMCVRIHVATVGCTMWCLLQLSELARGEVGCTALNCIPSLSLRSSECSIKISTSIKWIFMLKCTHVHSRSRWCLFTWNKKESKKEVVSLIFHFTCSLTQKQSECYMLHASRSFVHSSVLHMCNKVLCRALKLLIKSWPQWPPPPNSLFLSLQHSSPTHLPIIPQSPINISVVLTKAQITANQWSPPALGWPKGLDATMDNKADRGGIFLPCQGSLCEWRWGRWGWGI